MGRLALTLRRIGLSSIRIALLALLLPSFGIAATITVTDTDDVVFAGDGLCSLREALGNANDNAATYSDCAAGSGATPDNIVLDFGTPTTIVLTANLPTVAGDTVISGSFTNPVTIDGGGQFRHFVIDNGNNATYSEVTIEFLTLVNGHDAGPGGSIRNFEDLNLERVDFINNHASDAGGAVQSETGSLYVFECEFINNGVDAAVGTGLGGALQVNSGLAWLGVERSRFQGNTAALAGGAIQSAANTFYLTLSTFSGNTAQGSNGGAVVANGNGLTVETSSFDGNDAVNRGGGLYFNGVTAVVRKSTFSTNSAQYGSALSIAGSAQLTMENATVSGNGANNGGSGALTTFNTSTATVTASSFVQNTAPNGGRAFHAGNTSSISVFTSIISLSNLAAPLCGGLGTVTTDAFSVASNGTCGLAADKGSPLVNQMLPLADNGGPVPTHALLPSSPAIDWAADCKGITEDGRGFSRPIDGGSGSATCDAGA